MVFQVERAMPRGILTNFYGPVRRGKVMSAQRREEQRDDHRGQASSQPANAGRLEGPLTRMVDVGHGKFRRIGHLPANLRLTQDIRDRSVYARVL
jgi:hypothetical protein